MGGGRLFARSTHSYARQEILRLGRREHSEGTGWGRGWNEHFSERPHVPGVCFINSPPQSSEVNITTPLFTDKE